MTRWTRAKNNLHYPRRTTIILAKGLGKDPCLQGPLKHQEGEAIQISGRTSFQREGAETGTILQA